MPYPEEVKNMYLTGATGHVKKLMSKGDYDVEDWRIIRPGVRSRKIRVRGIDAIFRDTEYFCQDCRKDHFIAMHFMVKDDLWNTHCPDNGIICWKCFEARMGRPITLEDLTRCPVNEPFFVGARLAQNV